MTGLVTPAHAITGVTPRARGDDRGSDLAVTAGELNAGAGVARLGAFQETDDGCETAASDNR